MTKVINRFQKVKAVNGLITAKAVLNDGRAFFLHSSYNPQKEAQDWLEQIELYPHTAYVVLGLGMGYHIKALLERLPENSFIFILEYSRDESTLEYILRHFPDNDWLDDKRLTFLVGQDLHPVATILAERMRISSIKKLTICRHIPTMLLYPEFFANVETELTNKAELIFLMNHQFEQGSAYKYIENSWKNIPEIACNPGIRGFYNRFENKPAIVVSSGPSLNKNIRQLKEYQNNAIIIASGSAMGALHKFGIKPHFLAVADPHDIMYDVIKDDLLPETTLITLHVANHNIIDNYPGRKIFANFSGPSMLGRVLKYLPQTDMMATNVSVATMAFDFAMRIGANPIVFMGQDMAIPADGSHADGVKASAKLNEKEYYTVKGHNGEILKTIFAFKQLHDYFSSIIPSIKARTIINATEGGAYMPGAIHMNFSEVAERYLSQPFDIHAIVDEVFTQPLLSGRNELISVLRDVHSEAEQLRGETEKIIQWIGSQEIQTADKESVTRAIETIKGQVRAIQDAPMFEFIMFFARPLLTECTFRQRGELADDEEYFMYCDLLAKLFYIITNLTNLVLEAKDNIERQDREEAYASKLLNQ